VSTAAGLDIELSNLAELKYGVDRDRGEAKAELAGPVPVPASGIDRYQTPASPARIAELDRQSNELAARIEATAGKLQHLRDRQEMLDADLKAARSGFEAARTKLDDLKSAAGFRGERLEVLDPGIIPQRPTSPNTPLNLAVALLISSIGSFCYFALCFGLGRAQNRAEQAHRHW
jgi:uncharacterized protein involved in exopolysaccharide biosynthesis